MAQRIGAGARRGVVELALLGVGDDDDMVYASSVGRGSGRSARRSGARGDAAQRATDDGAVDARMVTEHHTAAKLRLVWTTPSGHRLVSLSK